MAFTGKKYSGSKILTDKTVENRKEFYKTMEEIKENNINEYNILKTSMLYSMFEHLTHEHEQYFIDWAKSVEWKTFIEKQRLITMEHEKEILK